MKKSLTLLFAFAFLFSGIILFSCKKEIVYEMPKGELKGQILLYGLSSQAGNSGVTVSVESPSGTINTLTDIEGKYDFKNLSAGIYNITFSKDSFATYKYISFQFFGGNIPYVMYPIQLEKLPYFQISNFQVTATNSYSVSYYLTLIASFVSTGYTYIRYYIDDQPDVSYLNYKLTGFVMCGNNSLYVTIGSNSLGQFNGGATAYVIIYPCANNINNMKYIDTNTGATIYPVNSSMASNVVSVVIPKITTNK